MATTAKKQFDESLINYYDEQLVIHADTVYRLAFALTLSLDGARKIVRHTFQNVAANLEKLHGGGEGSAMSLLVGECWKAYHDLKNEKFSEGQSAITKAMKPLATEARAALVSVDVAGLAPVDAARAFGWSEKDFRVHLANARRSLMMSTLDI